MFCTGCVKDDFAQQQCSLYLTWSVCRVGGDLEVPSFVNLSCRGTEAPNFDGLQEFIQLVDPVLWKGYCFASCSWSDTLSRDWMHHLTNETAHIWMCYSEWRVNSNQDPFQIKIFCDVSVWSMSTITDIIHLVFSAAPQSLPTPLPQPCSTGLKNLTF